MSRIIYFAIRNKCYGQYVTSTFIKFKIMFATTSPRCLRTKKLVIPVHVNRTNRNLSESRFIVIETTMNKLTTTIYIYSIDNSYFSLLIRIINILTAR